jgi:hypothetical protein
MNDMKMTMNLKDCWNYFLIVKCVSSQNGGVLVFLH